LPHDVPTTKDRIASAARQLLLDEGYQAMTYRAIAERCGIERTLVQHHFPKKETFLVDFLDELLAGTRDYVVANGLSGRDPYVNLFVIGQIHFSFLTMSERVRRLTLDIVADRALTERVIAFNESWALSFLHDENTEDVARSDRIAFMMGGAYQVVYRCLVQHRPLDVPDLLTRIMEWLVAEVDGDPNGAARLAPHALSAGQQERAVDALLSELDRT
jgi:AcrR family transcriptional regulator